MTAASSARVRPDARDLRSQVQRGEQTVTGGGVLGHDQVPGLLTAQGVAERTHRLEHVTVADGGSDNGDALTLHRLTEPEVGHHRRDDAVVRQTA